MRVVYLIIFSALFFLGCNNEGSSRSDSATDTTNNSQTISFSLPSFKDVNLSSEINSGDINISGITDRVDVVTDIGILYKNGTKLEDKSTTITNSDSLSISVISSSKYSSSISAKLTIGNTTKTFSVTTKEENLPNNFSFNTKENASKNESYTSNTVTIYGLESNSSVNAVLSSTADAAAIVNGEVISGNQFSLKNGDMLAIRLKSSSNYAGTTTATITIGSFSRTFSIITISAPTLSISTSSTTSMNYNQTQKLTAIISPSDTSHSTSWEVVNGGAIISIVGSTSGDEINISAIGDGVATIKATSILSDINLTATIDIGASVSAGIYQYNPSSSYTSSGNEAFIDFEIDTDNKNAYITNSYGLFSIDVNESSSNYMKLIDNLNLGFTERLTMTYAKDRLFVACKNEGIKEVNISSSADMSYITTYNSDYNTSSKLAYDVAVSGNDQFLFVANCAGVDMFDISSYGTMNKVKELNISGGNCDKTLIDNYRLSIMLNSRNRLAFFAYGEAGLKVLNIYTQPPYMEVNATYLDSNCSDVKDVILSKDETKAFLACGDDGVEILDISDLSSIAPLAHYQASGANAQRLSLSEDEQKLLVSSGTYGIDLIDISSINAPLSATKKDLSGYSYSIKYDTNSSSFFYATDSNRFYRFKITY